MKKAYIVGMAGGSCSGKSTFQDKLEHELSDLKIKSFHMDEYFKERSERPLITGFWNGKQYVDDNHPLTLDLDKFHLDIKEELSKDWDIILVEGVFALWDEEVFPLLDLKIYVDCDTDERMARRIKRHLSIGDDLDEIIERYVHAVKQRHIEYVEPTKWRADIILNGFQMTDLGMQIVVSWIRNTISSESNKN